MSAAKAQFGFLGGGQMARAIMGGLLREKKSSGVIAVFDPVPTALEPWRSRGCRICADEAELFANSEWLVWAIKPQVFHQKKELWKTLAFSGRGMISIMAGIALKSLESAANGRPVVRTMPNTPLMLGEGVVAIAPGASCSEAEVAAVEALFQPLGETYRVSEAQMSGVTAISGSGPAYLFYLAEEAVRRAAELRLDPALALKLWAGTVRGAARMMQEAGASPEALRRQVTSPGGTTEAAIRTLEESGVAAAFGSALVAAARRSDELSGGTAPQK